MGQKLLPEVVILRPFAIILLVVYHSFCIFDGKWMPIEDIYMPEIYKWISRYSYSFMLELFVFISGYVFSYQVANKGIPAFLPFVYKKFKRLILPSIVFSIIYMLLYVDYKDLSLTQNIMQVVEGEGHLWFLPMLFLSFLFCISLIALKIPKRAKAILVIALALIHPILYSLPLRIGASSYYLFFMMLGYWMYPYKETFLKNINWSHIMLAFITFVILFHVRYYIQDFASSNAFLGKSAVILACKMGSATVGLLTFFGAALKAFNKFTPPHLLLTFNRNSMGIYLFQQFILIFLYYHTSIHLFGGYILPWLGLIITLIASWIFTEITHKTKFGRFI